MSDTEVKLPPGLHDRFVEIERLAAIENPSPEESERLVQLIDGLTITIVGNLK